MTQAEQVFEKHVQLNSADNVVVALASINRGENVLTILASNDIPVGHKIAIQSIPAGQPVIKFGFPIGIATIDITAGDHVHEHNTRTNLGAAKFGSWTQPDKQSAPLMETRDVQVYQCDHDCVAIRNEIWIVNTVACVNQTANRLADRANRELLVQFPNVDSFQAFPHPYGCSQLGDDLSATQKILAGLANHPHAAGVLILGLGCENNRIADQLSSIDKTKLENLVYFNTQQVGDELEEGFKALTSLAEKANSRSRTAQPASKLVLGMKCGGSDGFSGITANPILGRIADRHCETGGTVLLTEIPEVFGAEQVLLSRCAHPDVYRRLIETVEDFKDYFRRHGQPISENPSPGNRDGGITTLEEKSLGCVQKAGTKSLIKQVLEYGERAKTQLGGIAIVNGPGNDGVSTTALTTAGANVILFTTGRGTPLGAPVPTIKVATNSELARAKPSWIDFDAGQLLTGANLDKLVDQLYDLILETAAGQYLAKNEVSGYREIAIWKTGVTL